MFAFTCDLLYSVFARNSIKFVVNPMARAITSWWWNVSIPSSFHSTALQITFCPWVSNFLNCTWTWIGGTGFKSSGSCTPRLWSYGYLTIFKMADRGINLGFINIFPNNWNWAFAVEVYTWTWGWNLCMYLIIIVRWDSGAFWFSHTAVLAAGLTNGLCGLALF